MILALFIILGASAFLIKTDLADQPKQNRNKLAEQQRSPR